MTASGGKQCAEDGEKSIPIAAATFRCCQLLNVLVADYNIHIYFFKKETRKILKTGRQGNAAVKYT